MTSSKTYKEIADELGVSTDTIRRTVRSKLIELNLEPKKIKTHSSKGAFVGCLSFDDAEKLIRFYKKKRNFKIRTDQ
ncbi:MAG: hypothetical protein KJ597_07515 [Nanoarchaeota archaeon]|nr:hypothetical protein [Nanoarchaeota archaeon]